ncbi:MAG TPA: FAD-dependent oxidoreductase [Gemmatimonadales bacterium]|nr:FAD-dependent oxidoreductase [Gemmatimonadales bacterium]
MVGGGVIGAACARATALRGLRVVLCEPGPDPAAASPAAAGLLAAQIESTDEWFRALGVRGRDLYESLAPALRDSTGLDIGFWRAGVASVAFDYMSAEELREAVARQRQAGLRCDWLEPVDVADRFPGAAPGCHGALFAPEDGAVDPAVLTQALLADAQRLGVTVRRARVKRVVTAHGRATGVALSRATLHAEHVVIAAGAWSPQIAGLPRPLPIEPVRGQMAAAPWPAGTPPAILYCDHGYVLPRGGEALFGSTMERVGFDASVTKVGIAQILSGAARLLPALAPPPPTPAKRLTRTWAGLRPVTPDGRPILGADPELPGLWYATGHGRNGVLLAALSGEIIGDLLAGKELDVDIAPFSPTRAFSGQP